MLTGLLLAVLDIIYGETLKSKMSVFLCFGFIFFLFIDLSSTDNKYFETQAVV